MSLYTGIIMLTELLSSQKAGRRMERDGMRNPFAFHDNGVHIAGMRSGTAPD